MAVHNGKFWRRQFHENFIPATHRVTEVFLDRLLPTFSKIESEVNAYAEGLWRDAMSQPYDPSGPDESEIAEAVQEAGVERYLGLKGMEQGVLNCCALFLHHLFEQQLMLFHRKEMLTPFEQDDISLMKHAELYRRLRIVSIDVTMFSAWGKLEELRLLANALKHGEGSSSRELAKVAPDLFKHPALKDSELHDYLSSTAIYTPLLGEELFVTAEKLKEYEIGITGFWQELSVRLNSA